ncbi:MAG: DsrE family protein [Proteobacteria bacterium]|nr:DsrE family protein [Pseudomonadota bacterium]
MSNDEHFSREFIHAFVDGQLTTEDKAEMYKSIHSDEALNQQVCEIRKLRDLVQLGYADLPEPPIKNRAMPRTGLLGLQLPLGSGIAAGIALLIGIAIGGGFSQQPQTAGAQNDVVANAAVSDSQKVLFHVNSGKTEDLREALDEVDQLLLHYAKLGQHAEIEVVTNGQGIIMLDADKSPFRERVEAMLKSHDNLTFVACQNSIEQLKAEPNLAMRMIPGTVVIDSGVAQIMRRQHQGWAYIQT